MVRHVSRGREAPGTPIKESPVDTETICTSATVTIGQAVTYVDRRLEGGSTRFHDGVVTAIDPVVESGRVTLLEVTSHTAEGERIRRRTRNLITSLGGSPRVPAAFQPAMADARVFHSHHYLAGRSRNPGARRYAIIGAGQSAAEIFMDLASDEANHVDLVARAYAPRPADETPFVNRIFDEEFIDHFYQLDAAQRAAFLEAFHHTNYAAIDVDLLHAMNRRLYEDRFLHPDRLHLRMRHEVSAVVPRADHVELVLTDLNTGRQYQQADHEAAPRPPSVAEPPRDP